MISERGTMYQVFLTGEEIDHVVDILYDRVKRSRLHHRTGENVDEPLFEMWIKLANLFRDAQMVTLEILNRPSTLSPSEMDRL